MGLDERISRLEQRYGSPTRIDLAALLRQGVDDATLRAAVDDLIARGQCHADEFALIRNHPAFAADRARVRAKLRQWHQDRGYEAPTDLADEADPGRPFQ